MQILCLSLSLSWHLFLKMKRVCSWYLKQVLAAKSIEHFQFAKHCSSQTSSNKWNKQNFFFWWISVSLIYFTLHTWSFQKPHVKFETSISLWNINFLIYFFMKQRIWLIREMHQVAFISWKCHLRHAMLWWLSWWWYPGKMSHRKGNSLQYSANWTCSNIKHLPWILIWEY